MQLEKIIIEILSEQSGLKAKDISQIINQRYKENVDKSEVNKILYSKLKGKVYQDNRYRWFINKSKHPEIQTKETADNTVNTTITSKLMSYYLECIARDNDSGVSEYASSRYGLPEYAQINILPQYAEDANSFYTENNLSRIVNKSRASHGKAVLYLGYPIYLKRIVKRSDNNEFFVVEPLLLFTINSSSLINNEIPNLEDSIPRLNSEAISSLSGLKGLDLMNDIMELTDDLGLNNELDDIPDLDELLARFKILRPEWSWNQRLEPINISETSLSNSKTPGIYNTAAIFISEGSKYTHGLEKELTELRNLSEEDFKGCSLGQWLTGQFPAYEHKECSLIEPLPLNDEQRDAVKKALTNPLTVVTGPPGTGKSQVVTSIIINAVHKGQTVLFASKNNKAVDVVFERANNITSIPVMIRMGGQANFSNISSYLNNILAATVSDSDRNNYEYYQSKNSELLDRLATLNQVQADIIKVRNEVDKLEKDIEQLRSLFSGEQFKQIGLVSDEWIVKAESSFNYMSNAINKATKNQQSILSRLFWPLLAKYRYNKVLTSYKEAKHYMDVLGVSECNLPVNESTIHVYIEMNEHFSNRLNAAYSIHSYFKSLNKLNNCENLGKLSAKIKEVEEEAQENSLKLWEYWLRMIPEKLGSEDRQIIGEYCSVLDVLSENSTQINNKVWAKYYNLSAKVTNIFSCWAVTSLSVKGRIPFASGFFDLVVIDEASQCDIASALPLLFRAKRAVIIGDDNQLKHISRISSTLDIQLLEKYDLTDGFLGWRYSYTSLFNLAQSLCKTSDIVFLRDHHRSHSDIIEFSNNEFYNAKLRIATKYNKLKSIKNEPAVRWINITGEVTSPPTGSSKNAKEAQAIIYELRRIVRNNYQGSIGVVTPFREQKKLINDMVNADTTLRESLFAREFLADVVHSFQGDERDIIIFSPVFAKGMRSGSIRFLENNGNLFNVAITRARAALIVVGDMNACANSSVSYLSHFVQYVKNLNNDTRKSTINREVTDSGPNYPIIQVKGISISDWEKALYEQLYLNGIKTIPQYREEQYYLDLALFYNNKKLDIEIDGENYHRDWDGEICKRDLIRNKRLIELGWDVQRFWVYQVRDNMQGCIDSIKSWMERTHEDNDIYKSSNMNKFNKVREEHPSSERQKANTKPTTKSIKTFNGKGKQWSSRERVSFGDTV